MFSTSMKFIQHIKRRLGWSDCPACGALVRLRFLQITIAFPDEPPMFGRWRCPGCKWLSPIGHSAFVDKAVQGLGYDDFEDWAHNHLPELKENHGTSR